MWIERERERRKCVRERERKREKERERERYDREKVNRGQFHDSKWFELSAQFCNLSICL